MASTTILAQLLKEARTSAGFTQEQLAKKVGLSLTAQDISKAERGLWEPTNEQLKSIAKLCGVTQKSLLDAKAESDPITETGTKKTTKSSGKTSTTKSTKSTTKKSTTPSNANTSMKVTATEKKLIEAYRAADSDTKKTALNLLQGKETDSSTGSVLGDVVSGLLGNLIKS